MSSSRPDSLDQTVEARTGQALDRLANFTNNTLAPLLTYAPEEKLASAAKSTFPESAVHRILYTDLTDDQTFVNYRVLLEDHSNIGQILLRIAITQAHALKTGLNIEDYDVRTALANAAAEAESSELFLADLDEVIEVLDIDRLSQVLEVYKLAEPLFELHKKLSSLIAKDTHAVIKSLSDAATLVTSAYPIFRGDPRPISPLRSKMILELLAGRIHERSGLLNPNSTVELDNSQNYLIAELLQHSYIEAVNSKYASREKPDGHVIWSIISALVIYQKLKGNMENPWANIADIEATIAGALSFFPDDEIDKVLKIRE